MLVVDTSAIISLELIDVFEVVLSEYEVRTTEHVYAELEETATYDDIHGDAATSALDRIPRDQVHDVPAPGITTSRVDTGEATCVTLARQADAEFLITDDLRALPELQQLTGARVAISPILLRALVKRGCFTDDEAVERLEQLAAGRDWLGAPIYRRARQLFES